MRTKPDGTLRSWLCKVLYNTYDLLKIGKTRQNELYSSLHHKQEALAKTTQGDKCMIVHCQPQGQVEPFLGAFVQLVLP